MNRSSRILAPSKKNISDFYFQSATSVSEWNLEMASFKKSPSLNAIKVGFVGILINSKGNWCCKSNQVTDCLIGNREYFEAVKQFQMVHQLKNSLSHLSS